MIHWSRHIAVLLLLVANVAVSGEVLWSRAIAPNVVAVYGRGLVERPYDTVTATMDGEKLDEIKEPFPVHHARQYFQLWQCDKPGELTLESKNVKHTCTVEPFDCGSIGPDVFGAIDGTVTGPAFKAGFHFPGRLTIRGDHVRLVNCTIEGGILLDGCSDVQIVDCEVHGDRPVDATFKSLERVSWYKCNFFCNDPQIGEPRRLVGPDGAIVFCRTHNCNRPLVLDEWTGPQLNQVVFGHWSDTCPMDTYRNERDGYVYHCQLVDKVQGVAAGSFAKLDRKTCTRYGTYAGKHMYAPGYLLANRATGEWSRIVSVDEHEDSLIVKMDRNVKATGRMVELWVGSIRTNCAHISNTSSGGRFGLTYWGSTQDEVVFNNTFDGCQQPVQVRSEKGVDWSDRMSFGRNRAFGSLVKEPVWYTPGGSALPELVGVQEW